MGKRGLTLALAGALVVGACTSSNSAGPKSTTTTAVAIAPTTTTVPTETMNLLVDDGVRAALTAAWADAQQLDPKYVKGTTLGSVYYGFDAQTHAYWALAEFDPTDAARQESARLNGAPGDPAIQFQGLPAAFTRPIDGEWNFVTNTGGAVCPPRPPSSLLAMWSIHSARACG
jgi:hypothetical protein